MSRLGDLLSKKNNPTAEAISTVKFAPRSASQGPSGTTIQYDVVDPITGLPLTKDGGFTKADRDAVAGIGTLKERLGVMRGIWDDFNMPSQPTLGIAAGKLRNIKAGAGYDSKVRTFESWRKPLTRGFARTFGEKGVLTDKDVVDFENTIPQVGVDGKQDADDKWDTIDIMLEIQTRKLYDKVKIKVIDANAPEVAQ